MRNRAEVATGVGGALLAAAIVTMSLAQPVDARQGGRGAPQAPREPAPGLSGAGAGIGAGPYDLPAVDAAAATRGRTTWAAECITCHGTQARGTEQAPNLVRSLVILKDRNGTELGPFLKKGHPMQSGKASTSLTDDQIVDLTHFLRQRVNDGLRGSPIFAPGNILTGTAAAGQAYFNGPGQCTQCHSVTGNLAGIGGRYSPVDLQQRVVFPFAAGRGRGAPAPAPGAPNPRAITVTVTPATGPALSGTLVTMDDFFVTLRDAAGNMQTVRRGPTVKVVKTNPLQFHIDLLDKITDKQMHDVVAYLETVK